MAVCLDRLQRQEIKKRVGKVTLLSELQRRSCPVPFAQLAAVRSQYHRNMPKLRLLPAERFIKQNMPRRAGNPFFGAYHVRNFHIVVVDGMCEVIGRKAVRFEHDMVVQDAVIKGDISPDNIV